MIAILLAAQMLSCNDGYWILEGLTETDLSSPAKSDMVATVLESMPDDCDPSDYNGRRK